MSKRFEPNQKVQARSACSHDSVWTATVTKRTPSRVSFKLSDGQTVTVKPLTDESGDEFAFFLGRYSMAPIFRA